MRPYVLRYFTSVSSCGICISYLGIIVVEMSSINSTELQAPGSDSDHTLLLPLVY